MKKNFIKKQLGRSMVEMLGVLAIIGVLSVGAIAGYNMAIEKHRLNQAIEAVQLIVAETRTLYAEQGNYNGLGIAISKDYMGETAGGNSVAAKILEKTKINTYYPIALGEETETYEGGFFVGVYNIPESSCIRLSTMNWQDYGDDFAGWGGVKKKLSFSEAQQACKEVEEINKFFAFAIIFKPTRGHSDSESGG